ncbi:MAG TPA: hypothetical protein VE860_08215 [Chthoniobacterales bacterium]|nr:hypothetical protein [Chthoniobacterales bacterium]
MAVWKINADERLISNYPRIMPRRNEPHITGAELRLGTVVHSHHYPSRDDMDQMAHLATVGSNEWLDRFRPTPSWLIRYTNGLRIAQLQDLYSTLVKVAYFVWGIKVPLYRVCHIAF